MKRRLFWKILLAFVLTFIAITQALWFAFELNRDERPGPEDFFAREIAPVMLVSAADTIRHSGEAGYAALLSRMAPGQSERMRLEKGVNASASPERGEDVVSIGAVSPDGTPYRITYRTDFDERGGSILNAPPEFIVVGLLGGLIFSTLLAWYLTEPINRLRLGFDRLAHGDLEARLGSSMGARRDEIADLGHDFDLMAQRLQQLVLARDRLLHDVSHELRSPLARLQLAIGLARQDPTRTAVTLDRIEREAQRLDDLVDQLLTLARVENGQMPNEEYFDLAGIIDSVADDARFEAQSKGLEIVVAKDVPDEDQRPFLRGDADLLRRAVDNVVRNALRFSSAGQAIDLAVRFDEAEHSYRIDISDQGPGVPEQDLEALFDPFVRGADGGAGLGLGLSIASRAIMAHGGQIVARNRDGGGLMVSIAFSRQALQVGA